MNIPLHHETYRPTFTSNHIPIKRSAYRRDILSLRQQTLQREQVTKPEIPRQIVSFVKNANLVWRKSLKVQYMTRKKVRSNHYYYYHVEWCRSVSTDGNSSLVLTVPCMTLAWWHIKASCFFWWWEASLLYMTWILLFMLLFQTSQLSNRFIQFHVKHYRQIWFG